MWVSYTDQGKTLSYTDDTDGDDDYADNCWLVANPDQTDTDAIWASATLATIARRSRTPIRKDTNGNGIGDRLRP